MRTLVLCLFLLALPGSVFATSINVGGTDLQVPSPSGFSEVTPEMPALYEIQKHFVAQTNLEYVAFISEKDVPVALGNEIPELERRFTVQTAKSLVNLSVSKNEFAEFKKVIKTQNDEILKKAEAAIGQTIDKINEDINDQYQFDLALSVSQMIPLPVHVETDRSMAYSAFVKYNFNDESGNPNSYVAVVTATFIHVKSKIVFLYSYAEEAGLDWSRNASSQWSNKVVEANPSDFVSTAKENLPAFMTRFNWGEVGKATLIGAFAGLLIGLVGWLVKRRKSS